ncbi:MAG: hypothetical protein WBC93_08555 [Sulfitobacter sp.]
MTNDPEILKKLTILASEKAVFRDGARVISNNLIAPLSAVLDEIDNTTLRRKLTFRAQDTFLSLLVAGRRVLSLVDTSDDLENSAPYLNVPLSRDDSETFEAVASILFNFADQKSSVSVESLPAETAVGRNEIGISVGRLAQLLEVDLDEERPKPVQHFVETCGDAFAACLFETDGLWNSQAKDTIMLAKLQKIADQQWPKFRNQYENCTQASTQPHLVVLEGGAEHSDLIAATWAQGEATLFACATKDFDHIHKVWRGLFTF